ncbi:MAG: hypothetical protein GXW91_13665 [Clostridiales bacterium]|nr:hypothetical protein [Clostridiales bacterium]
MEIKGFWNSSDVIKDENRKNGGIYYNVVIFLGMVLSILWIIFVKSVPFSDFSYYYNLAVSIANGGQWGDTYTSVGYPIVLAGVFKLFGASIFTAKVFNLLFTFINYMCFKYILFKVKLREIDKKIIFFIFVFFPSNIVYNNILGTELMFTSILFIITCLYFGDIKYKYFLMGVLTGLDTMVKPFFIVFFFAVFLVDIIKYKKFFMPLKTSLVVLVMCAVVISPWIYRNTKLMGQPTYVSNNGGIVLYINNNSRNSNGRWMDASQVENSVVKTGQYKSANRTQQNKMLLDAAKKWIKSHPAQFIKLGFKRLFNTYLFGDDILYSTYGSGINKNLNNLVFLIGNFIRVLVFLPAVVFILIYFLKTLFSIFRGESHLMDEFKLYMMMLFFMFTCVYFITEGQGRYAFPETFVFVCYFYFALKYIVFKFKRIRS